MKQKNHKRAKSFTLGKTSDIWTQPIAPGETGVMTMYHIFDMTRGYATFSKTKYISEAPKCQNVEKMLCMDHGAQRIELSSYQWALHLAATCSHSPWPISFFPNLPVPQKPCMYPPQPRQQGHPFTLCDLHRQSGANQILVRARVSGISLKQLPVTRKLSKFIWG